MAMSMPISIAVAFMLAPAPKAQTVNHSVLLLLRPPAQLSPELLLLCTTSPSLGHSRCVGTHQQIAAEAFTVWTSKLSGPLNLSLVAAKLHGPCSL